MLYPAEQQDIAVRYLGSLYFFSVFYYQGVFSDVKICSVIQAEDTAVHIYIKIRDVPFCKSIRILLKRLQGFCMHGYIRINDHAHFKLLGHRDLPVVILKGREVIDRYGI